MDVKRAICFCHERIEAMQSGTFRYCHTAGGWYFQDAPTRSMSSHARYYAFTERSEFPHSDHTGEPVIWVNCPHCGNELPGTNNGQADGEGTE